MDLRHKTKFDIAVQQIHNRIEIDHYELLRQKYKYPFFTLISSDN